MPFVPNHRLRRSCSVHAFHIVSRGTLNVRHVVKGPLGVLLVEEETVFICFSDSTNEQGRIGQVN